jgi:hypothetical protein
MHGTGRNGRSRRASHRLPGNEQPGRDGNPRPSRDFPEGPEVSIHDSPRLTSEQTGDSIVSRCPPQLIDQGGTVAPSKKSPRPRTTKRRIERTSRPRPSRTPLFKIQIVDAKTPTAPLKWIDSDELDKFRAEFIGFLKNELDKWIPADYELGQISFSIEVSGAPFGVGVSGSVGVAITKKQSTASFRQ